MIGSGIVEPRVAKVKRRSFIAPELRPEVEGIDTTR